MLGHRLRRRHNIKPALGKRLVFAGLWPERWRHASVAGSMPADRHRHVYQTELSLEAELFSPCFAFRMFQLVYARG